MHPLDALGRHYKLLESPITYGPFMRVDTEFGVRRYG